MIVPAIACGAMRWTVSRVIISVSLVPLLMPEFPLLLRVMFAQFRAVPINKSLALLVVVETIPFGPFVLYFGIFTPISSATPVAIKAPVGTI